MNSRFILPHFFWKATKIIRQKTKIPKRYKITLNAWQAAREGRRMGRQADRPAGNLKAHAAYSHDRAEGIVTEERLLNTASPDYE